MLNSLAFWWLRPRLLMQGAWVWSLVRELRSHMPHGVVKKKNIRLSGTKKKSLTVAFPHPFLAEKSLDFPSGKWTQHLGCCLVTQSYLTLRLHGLQHTRLTCPSPSPGVRSISCQLSWWCHPTISSSVTPSPPASIRVFSNESAFHIRWSNYWSFCFSISPSSEYSGWISLRID